MADFWNGNGPCWDVLGCPENIYSRCPAYHNRGIPCWEQLITQCRRVLGFEWECGDCKVFRAYASPKLWQSSVRRETASYSRRERRDEEARAAEKLSMTK